eukprot:gene14334-60_t
MTTSQPEASTPVKVGVLALQGSFREHMALLAKIGGVEVLEVRTTEELAGVDGLIIPGGESTTMALIAEKWGLIPELQAFSRAGKPVWGTCAGMIFLAERAEGQKKGGQALMGGLDISVSRNFFGAQINSFETQLPAHPQLQQYGDDSTFRAVFIRAPAVVEAGSEVEVLAQYQLRPEEAAAQNGRQSVAVAVRQGPLLATAFHPELTTDLRCRAVVPCLQPRLSLAPRPTAQLQKLYVAHFTEYTLSSDDKLDIMELCHKFDMTLNLGQQDRLGTFFVDEAEVITPLATVKGVKPILEYFEKCRPVAAGKRHLTCNIMVEVDGVNTAKVTAYRILHAASSPPALVATGIIEDRLVNVNGEWNDNSSHGLSMAGAYMYLIGTQDHVWRRQ